ncbi:MAG TPA: hypothetical protein GXZ51_01885 [Acholeplasma sp.]|nr:hypothetical protein [Acholeplasma sp.]
MKKKIAIIFLSIFVLFFTAGCIAKDGSTDIFRFDSHSVSMEVGQTKILSITGQFNIESEIEYMITEESEGIIEFEKIANDKVKITALSVGVGNIKAHLVERDIYAPAIIEVSNPKTSGIRISVPEGFANEMEIGEELQLGYSLTSNTNETTKVTWEVGDNEKATITADGKFIPQFGGNHFIYARTVDGGYAVLKVFVYYHNPTGVSIEVVENNSAAVTETNNRIAYLREVIKLGSTVLPETAENKVEWRLLHRTDDSIVIEDPTSVGLVINQKGEIYCTSLAAQSKFRIQAVAMSGDVEIKSNIITLDYTYAPVESVQITTKDVSGRTVAVQDSVTLIAGQSIQFNALVAPTNAAGTVSWSVNVIEPVFTPAQPYVLDPITRRTITANTLASVTQEGLLTTTYHGIVELKLSSLADSSISHTITVNILPKEKPVKIDLLMDLDDRLLSYKFYSDANVSTAIDSADNKKKFIIGTVDIVAQIYPEETYLDLKLEIIEKDIAFIIKDGTTSTTKGVTTFKLGILKEGILNFKISSQYSALNEYLAPIEKALNIKSEDFEIDSSAGLNSEVFDGVTYEYYEAISFSNIIDKAKDNKEFGILEDNMTAEYWSLEALDGSNIENAKLLVYKTDIGLLSDFLILGEGKFKITLQPKNYTKPLYTVVVNVVDKAK